MKTIEKLKNFFKKVLGKNKTKLLESGIEQPRDVFNKKNMFKESLKKFEVPWKDPNLEAKPIIKYKDIDISYVPIYLLEPPVMNKETFSFDGANRYTFKMGNLTEEQTYNMLEKITNMAIDSVGMLVLDSAFFNEFNKMGEHLRTVSDISSYQHKKGDNAGAIEKLEGLLRDVTIFRTKIMDSEEKDKHEERY